MKQNATENDFKKEIRKHVFEIMVKDLNLLSKTKTPEPDKLKESANSSSNVPIHKK
jgi:hypothetical protein